jgi:tetratricopeptide (TPR) repeat protein
MSHAMITRRPTHLLLALLCCASTACATSGAKNTNADITDGLPVERIELEPMLVQASPDGKPGRTLEASEVFELAYKAYGERRYEDALEHYRAVVKYFPDSKLYLPSLYNSGLTYEKLERWADAAEVYRRVIKEFSDRRDAKDAYFRLAETYSKLGEHDKIAALMTEALLRGDVQHFDRVEGHVRRNAALMELGYYAEAEEGFRKALRLNQEAPPDQQLPEGAFYIVQAQFGLGRALHLQVLHIPLVLPPERMGVDLERKANLFLQAQSAYIRALRVHHPQWSIAAGYMIGKLYEDFYIDIFSAEIPADLSEEALTLYFEELRKQLNPLMHRAISVYEKNLSLSKRIVEPGSEDEAWQRQTALHLQRLKSYLDDPFTQRRAEQLVRQKRPLEQLWDPHLTATDTVNDALKRARVEAAHPVPKT